MSENPAQPMPHVPPWDQPPPEDDWEPDEPEPTPGQPHTVKIAISVPRAVRCEVWVNGSRRL